MCWKQFRDSHGNQQFTNLLHSNEKIRTMQQSVLWIKVRQNCSRCLSMLPSNIDCTHIHTNTCTATPLSNAVTEHYIAFLASQLKRSCHRMCTGSSLRHTQEFNSILTLVFSPFFIPPWMRKNDYVISIWWSIEYLEEIWILLHFEFVNIILFNRN